LIQAIALAAAFFALVGALQQLVGTVLVERFVAKPAPSPAAWNR
jgi:hypothetical protein